MGELGTLTFYTIGGYCMNQRERAVMDEKHRSQLGRLRKIEGQVRGVQRMIEDGRYCMDVLTQMRAIRRALAKVEEQVLAEHVRSCVADAVRIAVTSVTREDKLQELMEVFASTR